MKNAAYVLPISDQSLEDFHWVAREILEGGGDASVCQASFVDGMTNSDIVALFRAARENDYVRISREIKELKTAVDKAAAAGDGWAGGMVAKVARTREKLNDIVAVDFFESPQRKQAEAQMTQIDALLRESRVSKRRRNTANYSGRTWVTRKDVHVDRIASAWLIRRFVDPKARFKFVAARGYRPQPDEIRFDMFDAEFTHEGNQCTLEVLMNRLNVTDKALVPIAEIIHDIDLKESKFGRVETAGVALVVNSICHAHKEDPDRIERASAVLDDLHAFFGKRPRTP